MEVRVTKRQGETHNIKLFKEATEYILKDLLDESILNEMSVVVSLRTSFSASACGDIVQYGTGRHFRVRINCNQNSLDQLVTLAHELVHVKQYATGELSLTKTEKSWRWKGKLSRIEVDDEEYDNTPWEKEARRKEGPLIKKFITHYFN